MRYIVAIVLVLILTACNSSEDTGAQENVTKITDWQARTASSEEVIDVSLYDIQAVNGWGKSEYIIVGAWFDYVPEESGDYWQTPQETNTTKEGDCEDWATYIVYIMSLKGYDAYVLCVSFETYAHHLPVIIIDGIEYMVDMDGFCIRLKYYLEDNPCTLIYGYNLDEYWLY